MFTYQALHTLVMTACANADDKSIAIANLAVTFAQAGQKTILVDADLRRPTQQSIWNIDSKTGLSTMITDSALMANPPLIQTSVENLSLLPSGDLPSVPADVLSHQRMNEIIGVLKARADYVIFDAPPVLAASDALLLGVKTDGFLLVIRAGSTRRDHVIQAKEALDRVKVNLLGTILTNAPRERNKQYGHT
ncbi:MAG: capsular biosynthesis protein [Phototrophicales bacterium]|nr:MAG: capsular biosynthesis protein [Phototrophicales bacterium]RMG76515.1 MAG: polysaccharide biosynthesis tyrosine autokinase [Chloroflexota bacterium]